MIMGYNVCHPTGQSRADKMADRLPDPSVVGVRYHYRELTYSRMFQFSFNGGVNPDSFIGDYHYQQATRERVSLLIFPLNIILYLSNIILTYNILILRYYDILFIINIIIEYDFTCE